MTYPNITDLVKNNVAYFDYYQEGSLFYHVTHEEIQYRFEVPIVDVGTGIMLPYDKAILYMRWIRKAIETETLQIV